MDRDELHDLQVALPGRQLEQHEFSELLAEERTADRRRHGHLPFVEVLGVAEDEVVVLLRLRRLVLDGDLGAHADRIGRDLRLVDGRELGEALREVTEARLHELLALKGGLVLRVLTEVAEFDGLPDLVGERDVQLEAELLLRARIATKTLAIDFTLGLEQGTGAEADWMATYKYQGLSSLNSCQKDRAIEQIAGHPERLTRVLSTRRNQPDSSQIARDETPQLSHFLTKRRAASSRVNVASLFASPKATGGRF